ncbi:MAG TPA: glycosyltransferase family A protein [Candidatus Saccharimonadales bacterium]|nr:glycosyltransferase family A protein [Candidatus Saccharimonadales bacterium]
MSNIVNISIIIPAYNEERHLARCLDAVAAQTRGPYEVIVVDNNSTDRTAAIAKKHKFVKLLHEPRQGVVFARNRGFDAARGNIIARIDADTVLPPDWLERVAAFYAEPAHTNQALTGGVLCYNLRLQRLVSWIQGQIVFRQNRLLLGHYILFGTNMAVPAKLWRAARAHTCQRTDIHEDLDLSIHLHRLGYQITYHEGLKVGAKMRRARSEHDQLWANLQWWPNTLRAHGNNRWPLAWLGALFLWLLSPLLPAMETAARLFGRPPILED